MSDQTTSQRSDHRIVVGVDGSECANRALDLALEDAHRYGSLLHIVTVYGVVPAEGLMVTPHLLDRGGAEEVVHNAMEHAAAFDPEVVTKGEIIFGAVGPSLVDVSNDAERLVVGTRGHSQVVGILLGSVSEHVIHHAHCTTTVVR